MKKLLFIALFAPIMLCAQDDKLYGNITAQILNPNYFTIQLPFLSVDFAQRNSNMFAEVGTDAKFGRVFTHIKYRVNYVDNLTEDFHNIPPVRQSSVYEVQASNNIALGMGFIIAKKEVIKNVRFHLQTRGDVQYIGVTQAPVTRFHAIQLGYTGGFTVVNGTGTRMVFNTPSSSNLELLPEETETMMEYKYISLGYKRGLLGWWRADIQDYGIREARHVTNLYANLLYMPWARLDDIAVQTYFSGYEGLYQRVSLGNTQFSRIGIAVGTEQIDFQGLGIYAKLEAGLYPGIQGSLGSRFGLSITSGVSIAKLFGRKEAIRESEKALN